MSSVEKFKILLKEHIKYYVKKSNEIDEKISEDRDLLETKTIDRMREIMIGFKISPAVTTEITTSIPADEFLGKDNYAKMVEEETDLATQKYLIKEVIFKLQNYINVYDEKRVKSPLEIGNLLIMLEELYINAFLNVKDISVLLGMAIVCNAKNPSYNSNNYLTPFLSYYNADGSFMFNEDIDGFKELINQFLKVTIDEIRRMHEDENYLFVGDISENEGKMEVGTREDNYFDDRNIEKEKELFRKICNLLRLSNERYLASLNEVKEKTKQNVTIPFKYLAELQKYYRNGELIAVPSDMNEFVILLDNCGFSDEEIIYLLSLIEEATKPERDAISSHLSNNDLVVYEEAKRILENISEDDPDYCMVEECFSGLLSLWELIEVTTDDAEIEYLLEEKNSIISCLKEFIEKYRKVNNIVFLDKNAFDEDLSKLGKMPKNLRFMFDKITKENQLDFKRVITNSDIPYLPYEVESNGVSIFFIEIDFGIYVIIGAGITGKSYRKIISRIYDNELKIQNLEMLVGEIEARNKLLLKQEESVESYNIKNMLRQRTNKNN